MQNTSNRNMTRLEELHQLAYDNSIPIDTSCPADIISMSVRLPGGLKIIGLSADEISDGEGTPTSLECLAHELGHCITDSFYTGYSPLELRAKPERRADAWAIEKLIPYEALCAAVSSGCREVWELSEYFGVSGGFILKTVDYYKSKNKSVPEEYSEIID